MPVFIIQFLLLLISLSSIISCIGVKVCYKKDVDIDSQYINEEVDYDYYDKSLIEKKKFRKMFLDITNLRSLKQLFR